MIISIAVLLLVGVVVWRSRLAGRNTLSANNNSTISNQTPDFSNSLSSVQAPIDIAQNNPVGLMAPIDRAGERVTKKPFGIFITPQNSPVSPERFSGFHTGTDFETFPEEANVDVPIHAITDGKILAKEWVSGYGGVLVESGQINNQSVTIIYGHLNLTSINKKTGDNLAAGEKIGVLGKGYSQQTDGERKHLHLGIHKGTAVNILGYVNNKSGLGGWIDPISLF